MHLLTRESAILYNACTGNERESTVQDAQREPRQVRGGREAHGNMARELCGQGRR